MLSTDKIAIVLIFEWLETDYYYHGLLYETDVHNAMFTINNKCKYLCPCRRIAYMKGINIIYSTL